MEILLTSKPTIEKPVDSILPYIAAAVAEWKVENSPEIVRQRVLESLNKQGEALTLKLLGFNTNWSGKWEVDHCNGRGDESAVGDYFKKCQSAAIKEWLETMPMPSLTPAEKKALQKDWRYEYKQSLERAIRDGIQEQASADAAVLIKQMSQSGQIDNYLKTMALLAPA